TKVPAATSPGAAADQPARSVRSEPVEARVTTIGGAPGSIRSVSSAPGRAAPAHLVVAGPGAARNRPPTERGDAAPAVLRAAADPGSAVATAERHQAPTRSDLGSTQGRAAAHPPQERSGNVV